MAYIRQSYGTCKTVNCTYKTVSAHIRQSMAHIRQSSPNLEVAPVGEEALGVEERVQHPKLPLQLRVHFLHSPFNFGGGGSWIRLSISGGGPGYAFRFQRRHPGFGSGFQAGDPVFGFLFRRGVLDLASGFRGRGV